MSSASGVYTIEGAGVFAQSFKAKELEVVETISNRYQNFVNKERPESWQDRRAGFDVIVAIEVSYQGTGDVLEIKKSPASKFYLYSTGQQNAPKKGEKIVLTSLINKDFLTDKADLIDGLEEKEIYTWTLYGV